MGDLERWVAAHCEPGSQWRWHARGFGLDVVMELGGYKTANPASPYYIEIEQFWVVSEGARHPSLPHGHMPLPRQFSELIARSSRISPGKYNIDSPAFKSLADDGVLVREGR